MREKLIELISQIVIPYWAEQIANHLIDNDVVPVVRCNDCAHRKEAPHHDGLDCCPMWGAVGLNPWGFCNLGKPKEDKHD